MAARKKKTSRKKGAVRKRGGALLKTIDKELASLQRSIDRQLAPLRKEIEKAERQAGTGGARVIREARKRLNQIEIKGRSDWTQFLRKSRRDLSGALTELEKTVRPKKKKATKKKATKKKKA